ncbi:PrpF protein [Paraphoma chrysanthemicola]|nr:PrpF protein [Paraphoma chrysanthemicola]
MRAGTSKGLFVHRRHLPSAEKAWAGPLLAAMGSQHSDARQIDGVGGATSTTSKVAVVSPSSRPGIDVDYTFVQVAVGQEAIDLSGNCGNMCAGVGPFALQEGLVQAPPGPGMVDIRIFNTNTSRVIVSTIEVDADGSFNEHGTYAIPGVSGTGSEVKLAFLDPAGSMTGQLFPSGQRSQTLAVSPTLSVTATLIDAANPFVLVDASTLPASLAKDSQMYLQAMESIRRAGAVAMGLAPNTAAAAKIRGTPKLALVSAAQNGEADTVVQAFSMGKPHPSLQITGAACIAAAVRITGTVAHRLASSIGKASDALPSPERTPEPESSGEDGGLVSKMEAVRVKHPTGCIEVGVLAACSENWALVKECVVSRTARRLFEGRVWYYQ